ncbi:MAG: serine/threonine-protein kinase [Sandaracinus sp.]
MSELADESPEALVGRRLDHYLILDTIGGGAMGHVYRARDVVLRRTVALKVHRAKRGSALGRFQQEGRALLALQHPGIAEIYEHGETGGHPYIAMELVEGPTLADLLRHGGVGWPAAALIAHDVARALGHAHRHGTVHRDLKPSNVIVSSAGVVKLVDFGLAKQIAMPEPAEDEATVYEWSGVHTAAGAVLGTPAYMSPEQARARPIDARADVFSLGALLHELVTGVAIFRRASPAATIGAILASTPPRLDKIDPRVPRWLADLVERALAKAPEERFADGNAVADALAPQRTSVDLRGLAQDASFERFSPTRTSRPSLRPGSLVLPPRPTTRFVGRDDERRELREAAARGEPLVIVRGPAGVGKSRLVREHLEERGEDDALVVLLDTAEGEEAVAIAVAAAVGALRPERIGARLSRRGASVIVLDGVLLPLDRAIPLVRAWSEQAPGTRFVLTTEDHAAAAPGAPVITVAGLPIEPATELLLERLMASADDPARVLDARSTAQRVAEIVLSNPLALEIAAALAAPAHAPELAPVLDRLEAGAEAAAEGSTETSFTIDGLSSILSLAVEDLDATEQDALAALAVVPAFDRTAAGAIAGIALDQVDAWVSKVLARGLAYAAPHPDLVGVPRWALRAPVRQRYAHDPALAPLRARAWKRAAKHFAVRAHARRDAMRTAPAREIHREIALDEPAVLALADAAIRDASLGIDALVLETLVAQIDGATSADKTVLFGARLDALLARALASGADADVVLDALLTRAASQPDAVPAARRDEADRALAWAERTRDPARIVRARILVARALLACGELGAAATEAGAAVDEARLGGVEAELVLALELAAETALERGELRAASDAADEARELTQRRDDAYGRLRTAMRVGAIARELAAAARERAVLEDALDLSRASGHVESTAAILLELAQLDHRAGALARAQELVTQAASLQPESGTTADAIRLEAATLALERGDAARAASLAAPHEAETERSAIAIAIAAAARAVLGDVEPSTRLFARAEASARDALEQAAIELWRGHLDMAELPGERGILAASARLEAAPPRTDDVRPGSRHAYAIAQRALEARLPRRASLLP